MVLKYIPFDKWSLALKMIKHNGGFLKTLDKLWHTDALKIGTYMGTDCFGNKYYENTYYMIGRSRWVDYNPSVHFDYNASQVNADWFGWLHYKTDLKPCEDCAKFDLYNNCYTQKWLTAHEENNTGTRKAYYPYSTTRPHICVWNGGCIGKKSSKPCC